MFFLELALGVLVIVIAEFIIRLSVKPLSVYRDTVKDIAERIAFNSNVLTSGNCSPQLSDHIRNSASNLEASYVVIPFRKLHTLFKVLPTKNDILMARRGLYQISNSCHKPDSIQNCIDAKESVKKLLKIDLEN